MDSLNKIINAVINNDIDKIKSLMEPGIDLDEKDLNGRTSLIIACQKGHLEIARILLNSGANYALYDNAGKNAMHYAIESGYSDIVNLIKQTRQNVAWLKPKNINEVLSPNGELVTHLNQFFGFKGLSYLNIGLGESADLHIKKFGGGGDTMISIRHQISAGESFIVVTKETLSFQVDSLFSELIGYMVPFATEDKIFSIGIDNRQPNNENKKEGCFIATAVYGSYSHPSVVILRKYRDMILSKNILGKLFIRCYYFLSPVIAKKITKHSYLSSFLKNKILNPFIIFINKKYFGT